MRPETLLVTTSREGRSRKVLWDTARPLWIDHPEAWRLEQLPTVGLTRVVSRAGEARTLREGVPLDLRNPYSGKVTRLTLARPGKVRPAYEAPRAPAAKTDARVCLFRGFGEGCTDFRLAPKAYVGRVGRKKIFTMKKTPEGYEIRAKASEATLSLPDRSGQGERVALAKGEKRLLKPEDLNGSAIRWRQSWWRLRSVDWVDDPSGMAVAAGPLHEDALWFRRLGQRIAVGLLLLALLILALPLGKGVPDGEPGGYLSHSVLASLKPPHAIPVFDPPVPEAQAVPVTAPAVEIAGPPDPLPAPEPRPAAVTAPALQPAAGGSSAAASAPHPAKHRPASAPTRSRKRGHLALKSMHSARRGGEMGDDALVFVRSSKGMILGGKGKLAETEIERILTSDLGHFQDCYEKSLAAHPKLSGRLVMQWMISAQGGSSNVTIVRSQLADPGLHQCLAHEIGALRFPSPKGGGVTVSYPFAFSSGRR